jgi:type II secretory pathway component PulJ
VVIKPVANSRIINSRLLMMNGHFLPHLSAAKPKPIAPTERNMSTSVIPHVMSFFERSNSLASAETVSETVKKSNESIVHAQKATRKKRHCCQVSRRNVENGFGGRLPGGRREVKRVAMYLPTLVRAILRSDWWTEDEEQERWTRVLRYIEIAPSIMDSHCYSKATLVELSLWHRAPL